MIETFIRNLQGSDLFIRSQLVVTQIQTNIRLRRMLWGVVYILVLYLYLIISDALEITQNDSEGMQKSLFRFAKYENRMDWDELLDHELKVGRQLQDRLWTAASPGLAEADFQTFLQQVLQDNQMDHMLLKLGEARAMQFNAAEYWIIQAEVTGTIDRGRVLKLISDLASHNRLVKVERFTYSPERGKRVNLLLTAYFKRTIT